MKITVLGSGAWGTALALLLLENGNDVTLWSYTEEESRVLRETRENPFLNALAEAVLQFTNGLEASFLVEYVDEKGDEFQTAARLYREKRLTGCIFLGGHIDERAQVLQQFAFRHVLHLTPQHTSFPGKCQFICII